MPRTAVDVDLRARDRTRAAFASAQRGLDGLIGKGGRLAGLFGRAGPIGAGVASIGIAAGLAVRALVQVVDQLDSVDKASKRVGVSAEELQALRLAAQLGGAEVRQTDIALQRFSRRIGEIASLGKGELLPTFEKMNIRVRNLDGTMRSNVDILDEYVEKIKEMGSSQEQTAAIFKGFDSEGVRFGRALVESGTRVRDLTEAFREQGLIIEGRYVQQAAAARDAMTLLAAQWKVAGTELLVQFLPALQASIPFLRTMAREVARIANNLGDLFDTRPNEALLDELEELIPQMLERQRLAKSFERSDPERSARYAETAAKLEARIAEVLKLVAEARAATDEAVLQQANALGGADPTVLELAEAQLRAEEKSLAVRRALLELKRERKLVTEEEYLLELRKLEGAKAQAAVEKTVGELARARVDAALKEERVQRAVNAIYAERARAMFDIGELTREQIERLRKVFGAGEEAAEQDGEAIARKERILELTEGVADALAGFSDSTEGWLRLLGQALRLWRRFEFGGGFPSGGLFGSGGGLSVPTALPPSGATNYYTTSVNLSGVDYGADFAAQVDAQAPRIAAAVREAVGA